MDPTNKIVSLEQKIHCILVHDLSENKTENTDAVGSAIFEHLNIVISEEDIDRFHRVRKFDPAKTKPRPVMVKFTCYNVCYKVFANQRK